MNKMALENLQENLGKETYRSLRFIYYAAKWRRENDLTGALPQFLAFNGPRQIGHSTALIRFMKNDAPEKTLVIFPTRISLMWARREHSTVFPDGGTLSIGMHSEIKDRVKLDHDLIILADTSISMSLSVQHFVECVNKSGKDPIVIELH